MNKIMSVFLCFLFCVGLFGQKVVEIPELLKPNDFVVDGRDLIVLEKTTIYVFSLKDFKLKAKFGKSGEGPQEFKESPFGGSLLMVVPYPDYLFVQSEGKISYYKRNGEYIRERKTSPFMVIREIKDKFVIQNIKIGDKMDVVMSLELLDKDFKKLKELCQYDKLVGNNFTFELPMTYFGFNVYEDKIFVALNREEIVIDVFDSNGKKLYCIEKNYPKLKVDEAFKAGALKELKEKLPSPEAYEEMKKRIKFKTNYPPIKKMIVIDGKIYILTYKKKNDQPQCIVMDLKGKEIKQTYLPLIEKSPVDIKSFSIKDGKLYTLVEDEDEEIWNLHIYDIK